MNTRLLRPFVFALGATALSVLPRGGTAHGDGGFPGNGTDDMGFDPGHGVDSPEFNLVGVNLSELYGVDEPFVNYANLEIEAGQFYIINFHSWFVADACIQVPVTGQLCGLDVLRWYFTYVRYVISGEAPFKTREYVYIDEDIENTWDYAHDDALTCGDFFPGDLCLDPEGLGIPASTPMITWLPKLPPLPPGTYHSQVYIGTIGNVELDGPAATFNVLTPKPTH